MWVLSEITVDISFEFSLKLHHTVPVYPLFLITIVIVLVDRCVCNNFVFICEIMLSRVFMSICGVRKFVVFVVLNIDKLCLNYLNLVK